MAIEVGNIIDGTVSGITKFGVFVDLGEKQTGLVHISEVAHGYIEDINERLHDLKRNTEGKRGGRGGRRD